jgi:hypothetical protein
MMRSRFESRGVFSKLSLIITFPGGKMKSQRDLNFTMSEKVAPVFIWTLSGSGRSDSKVRGGCDFLTAFWIRINFACIAAARRANSIATVPAAVRLACYHKAWRAIEKTTRTHHSNPGLFVLYDSVASSSHGLKYFFYGVRQWKQ